MAMPMQKKKHTMQQHQTHTCNFTIPIWLRESERRRARGGPRAGEKSMGPSPHPTPHHAQCRSLPWEVGLALRCGITRWCRWCGACGCQHMPTRLTWCHGKSVDTQQSVGPIRFDPTKTTVHTSRIYLKTHNTTQHKQIIPGLLNTTHLIRLSAFGDTSNKWTANAKPVLAHTQKTI